MRAHRDIEKKRKWKKHKQADILFQPSPVPKGKNFLGRHLGTEWDWLAHTGQGQESNPWTRHQQLLHCSFDMGQQWKGRKVADTAPCLSTPTPPFPYYQGRRGDRVSLGGSPCMAGSQKVARRRGGRSVRAEDEMTENSGTCLVAIPSAVEESISNSSLLYIIHENRETELITSESCCCPANLMTVAWGHFN